MNKTNLILISVLVMTLGLASCTTTEERRSERAAETATKPFTTTTSVVKDSVIGVNSVMGKVMKDVNSAIALPDEKPLVEGKADTPGQIGKEIRERKEAELIKEKPATTE